MKKNISNFAKRCLTLILILTFVISIAPKLDMFDNIPSDILSNDNGGNDPPNDNFTRMGGGDPGDDEFVPDEVIAPADSKEDAMKIAKSYGLEFESYAYGIAVFKTTDPKLAVEQSKKSSLDALPQLSYNHYYELFETAEATLTNRTQTKSVNSYEYDREQESYITKTYSDREQESDITKAYSDSEYERLQPKWEWKPLDDNVPTNKTELQWHHAEMDTERAWDISTGENVVIAVIDTGIDIDHPDFEGRISPISYNSYTDEIGLEYVRDDHGHGTHVSGIAAGKGENVFGVAPDAQIMKIKANTTNEGLFESSALLRGINYATENGADIINMSLGREYSAGGYELEHTTIVNAVENGVTVICAAGNERDSHAGWPAAYPEAIAVSATKQGFDFDSSYSNCGPEIDIAAPGTAIYSTQNGGDYVAYQGTSMASPNVAGVAALIKSLNPEYTPQQIKRLLCRIEREADVFGKNIYYGYGIVNAYASVVGFDSLYSVSYDLNYDDIEPFVVYSLPDGIIKEIGPLRENYILSGWYTSDVGGTKFNFNNAITGNIKLYAQWVEPEQGMFAVEFPDDNFRREVLRLINSHDGRNRSPADIMTTGDFEILANIEKLDLINMNIEKLDGIKYFTMLQYLYCDYNRLSELELIYNTELIEIWCNYNQLTNLDLSDFAALELLVCNNNQLIELNVSGCINLIDIICHNNKLKALDLKHLSKVVFVQGFNNQLTELNLKGCKSLEVLWCPDNAIKKIDVSDLIELECLNLAGNSLEEIDVSKNINLITFHVSSNRLTFLDVTKNIELQQLGCVYNELTILDVSENLKLVELWCAYNNLIELFLPQSEFLKTENYIEFESKYFFLKSGVESIIECGNNQLTSLDVSENPSLLKLNAYRNQLTVINTSNVALEFLDVRENQLATLDVSKNAQLEVLIINENPLTEIDVSKNAILRSLDASGVQLTELDISKNTMLKGLGISDNQLTELNVSQNVLLDNFICSNNQLEELDVSKNTALAYLECQNNPITNLKLNNGKEMNIKIEPENSGTIMLNGFDFSSDYVSLSATPNNGDFLGWQSEDITISDPLSNSIDFNLPDGFTTLTARFSDTADTDVPGEFFGYTFSPNGEHYDYPWSSNTKDYPYLHNTNANINSAWWYTSRRWKDEGDGFIDYRLPIWEDADKAYISLHAMAGFGVRVSEDGYNWSEELAHTSNDYRSERHNDQTSRMVVIEVKEAGYVNNDGYVYVRIESIGLSWIPHNENALLFVQGRVSYDIADKPFGLDVPLTTVKNTWAKGNENAWVAYQGWGWKNTQTNPLYDSVAEVLFHDSDGAMLFEVPLNTAIRGTGLSQTLELYVGGHRGAVYISDTHDYSGNVEKIIPENSGENYIDDNGNTIPHVWVNRIDLSWYIENGAKSIYFMVCNDTFWLDANTPVWGDVGFGGSIYGFKTVTDGNELVHPGEVVAESMEINFDSTPFLIENTKGYWDTRWNNDTQDYEEYYRYYGSSIDEALENAGMTFTIHFDNGTKKNYKGSLNDIEWQIYADTGQWIYWYYDQYENPWKPGSNPTSFYFMNTETIVNVDIVNVESFEVTFDKTPTFIEGGEGFWDTKWNDEAKEFEQYFVYDIYDGIYSSEMQVKINFNNNASKIFNGSFNDVVNIINYEVGYSLEWDGEQLRENPWELGKNTLTMQLIKYEWEWDAQDNRKVIAQTNVDVEVLESPVDNIQVSIDTALQITEGTNGSWETKWNEETETWERYFYYNNPILYDVPIQLTVNYKDGTVEIYTGDFWDIWDEIYDNTGYRLTVFDNQYNVPWNVGFNTTAMAYMGKTFDIEVEIIESPVDRIEISFDQPIQIKENVDGYWNDGIFYYDEWYLENYIFNSNVEFTIYYKNGENKVYNGSYGSVNVEVYNETGNYISWETIQYSDPWKQGKNPIIFDFMGKTTEEYIEVFGTVSIEVEFETALQIIEQSHGWWDEKWNPETKEWESFYIYNESAIRERINNSQAALTLTFSDGTKKDYTGEFWDIRYQVNDDTWQWIEFSIVSQYEKPWERGLNPVTLSLGNTKTDIFVEVIEDPFDRFEVKFDPDVQITENTYGYWDWSYYLYREYYHYDIWDILNDNPLELTMYYKDGTNKIYKGTIYDISSSIYNDTGMNLYVYSYQEESPWTIGKNNPIYIYIDSSVGFETELFVEIIPPVVIYNTITFNYNYANSLDTFTIQVRDGESLGTNFPENPTREGYTFQGWFNTPATTGGTQITNSTTFAEDRTAYARWAIARHTVTATATAGGTVSGGGTYNYNSQINLVATADDGYTFDGWYLGGMRIFTDVTFPFDVTTDLSIQARFIPIVTHTVRFMQNRLEDDDTVLAERSIDNNTALGLINFPATPTKDGYNFKGWFTARSGGTEVDENTIITQDTDIFAQWEIITYTITYNANGGTGAPTAETKTHDVDFVISSVVPTRENHTFLGWAETATATTAEYQSGGAFTKNAETTLYAVWEEITVATYTITYDANGGTNAPTAETKTHDLDLIISSVVPTRGNHTFLGWAESATATEAEYQSGGAFTKNAETTLYAVWVEDGIVTTYNITYDMNGGTGEITAQTKTHDVDLVLSDVIPTRANHTFLGWAETAAATEFEYQSGGVYAKNADVILYAVWVQENIPVNYTITYNANGGTGTPAQQTKTHGVNLTLSNTRPTRANHTFIGWNTNRNATTAQFAAGGTYTANNDAAFFAIWRINTHRVRFMDGNSAMRNPAARNVNHGTRIQKPTNPKKSGHVFAGWFTTKNGNTQFKFGTSGTQITKATDIYARFARIPSKPAKFTAKRQGTRKARLTWTAQSGVVMEIRYRRRGTSRWTTRTTKAGAKNWTSPNLARRSSFEFQVRGRRTVNKVRADGSWTSVKRVSIK